MNRLSHTPRASLRRLLSWSALAALLSASGLGLAQPGDPAAEGQALYDRARAAEAEGKLEEACNLYAESDAQAADEWVRLDLARCLEKKGDTAAAIDAYERVAEMGGDKAHEAREQARRLRGGEDEEPAPGPRATEAEPLPPPPAVEEQRHGPDPQHYVFSDFIDTRLTWTIGDDDVLHATGETVPLSPNVSIGDRRRYRLFFDNLNSVFAGRENITHLVLYKKMPGFIERLETEASMVLRFDLASLASGSNNLGASLYDSGSFIRLFYRTGDAEDSREGLGLTLFPIDTDRFRLGYLYDITWGGTNPRINQSIFPRIQGSSPGFKFQYDHELFYVFAGMKTAQIVQVEEILTPGTSEVETIRIGQTNYGFLGGGGVTLGDYVNLDVGGGYFQQGKFDLPDVLGEDVFTFGFSGR
ncbi:MAG: tetratricopeptide repeat protein, partial [Myxococcales bacterium]|nr:tetratricopeptide repeat protein [Myxococcales bacterium]